MECMDEDTREWFKDLTPERRAVVTARMGKLIEERVGIWDNDTDRLLVEESFIAAVEHLFLQDIVEEWVEKGLIYCTGIDGDGNFMYATP